MQMDNEYSKGILHITVLVLMDVCKYFSVPQNIRLPNKKLVKKVIIIREMTEKITSDYDYESYSLKLGNCESCNLGAQGLEAGRS